MYLQLTVIAARGLYGDPENLDPFVIGICGNMRFNTNVQSKTNEPFWNEQFTIDFSSKKNKKLILTVWDKDYVSQDVFIGCVTIEKSEISMDGSQVWYQLEARHGKNDNVSGEVKLSFVPGIKSGITEEMSTLSKTELKKSKSLVKSRIEAALLSGVLEVDLTSCELSDNPDLLRNRNDWISLDLGFNRYSSFPDLSMYSYLEKLWLTGNQIVDIGEIIGTLVNLKFLYLNGNQIRNIPAEIGNLVLLEHLDLANNEIIQLPEEIGALTNLEELLVGGNQLRTFPESIGELVFLEKLDANGCNLQDLPNNFCGMVRLLDLDLGTNHLRRLPGDFGHMSRLVELNLSDNQLTDLPRSMGSCINLDTVLLERNNIQDEELKRKYMMGSDHLVDYLQKKLFAFEQEQKRRQRQVERRKEAAKKLRQATGKELQEEVVEENVVEDENLTPEEKILQLRSKSVKFTTDIKNRTITLKRALAKSTSLEHIIFIAKAIRELIPHMNSAREQMVAIPKPKPPTFFGNESKLVKLKKTTAVAMRECESVIDSVTITVNGLCPPEILVELHRVLKDTNDILLRSCTELPDELKEPDF